jgi:hypothetical protein
MMWGGVVVHEVVWWCSVVWCGVVWCGMVWCGMVWYGMAWCGMIWYGMVWCGVVWCGVVWYGMVWCGMVWYGCIVCTMRTWSDLISSSWSSGVSTVTQRTVLYFTVVHSEPTELRCPVLSVCGFRDG